MSRAISRPRLLALLVLGACGSSGSSQPSKPPPTKPAPVATAPPARAPGYDLPPQNVLDVLHAPSPPQPMLSPTRTSALLVSWVQYPPMAQVAEPYLKLAGVRVEPRTRPKPDTAGGYGIA